MKKRLLIVGLVSVLALGVAGITGCMKKFTLKKEAADISRKAIQGKVEINKVMLLNIDEDEAKEIFVYYTPAITPKGKRYISLINQVNGDYKEMWTQEIWGHTAYKMKILDLDSDNINEIFYVSIGGGGGVRTYALCIYSPKYQELFSLFLNFDQSSAEPIPEVDISSNLKRRKFKIFRDFLDKEKKNYDYTDAQELLKKQDDPTLAPYFWKVDNGYINKGKIKIREYKGKPPFGDTYAISLEEGNYIWYAYFQGGVYEYNKEKDTFFTVWFPEDVYSMPSLLRKKGEVLYIGTEGYGYGIIVYHTKQRRLKQFAADSFHEIFDMEIKW